MISTGPDDGKTVQRGTDAGKPKKQMITPKQKAVILFACIVFAMVVAVTVTQ